MGNTEIRLNPDKVQGIISDLSYFNNFFVSTALMNVIKKNDGVDKPYQLDTFKTNVNSHSENLKNKIADLQTCLDAAKAANDCGITTKKSDGTIAYIVADGHAESIENIKTDNHVNEWRSAQKDAKALSEALNNTSSNASGGGVSSDGRTIEQILDDMGANADNPYYGSMFVKNWSDKHGGFDAFLQLPISAQMAYTEYDTRQSPPRAISRDDAAVERFNGVLGRVLAAATHTSTVPEGFNTWAEAVSATVQKEGQRGLRSSANQLLAAPDAVYDTDFLVDLAVQFEKLPYDGDPASKTPDSIWGNYDHEYGAFYNEGRAFSGGSMDPMYGVLSAMKNNSYAAIRYLAPDGSINSDGQWVPGKVAQDRWNRLTSRNWDSEVGLDAFTAAQASASSYRGSSEEKLYGPATWITRKSMAFAVDDVKSEDITDQMKANLSVLVANSADDAISIANDGYPESLRFTGDPDAAANMYSSLIYRVMDNENAAATISTALANEAAHNHPGDVNGKFQEAATALGYVYTLGKEKADAVAKKDAAKGQQAQTVVDTTTSLAFTVLGGTAMASAGPAAPLVWSAGTTIAKPLLFGNLSPQASAKLEADAKPGSGEDAKLAGARKTLETQAYAELANSGKLPSSAMDPNNFTDSSTHKPYSWYNEDDESPVSLSAQPTNPQRKEVHQWSQHAKNNGGSEVSSVFDDVDGSIDDGMGKGVSSAQAANVK